MKVTNQRLEHLFCILGVCMCLSVQHYERAWESFTFGIPHLYIQQWICYGTQVDPSGQANANIQVWYWQKTNISCNHWIGSNEKYNPIVFILECSCSYSLPLHQVEVRLSEPASRCHAEISFPSTQPAPEIYPDPLTCWKRPLPVFADPLPQHISLNPPLLSLHWMFWSLAVFLSCKCAGCCARRGRVLPPQGGIESFLAPGCRVTLPHP